jgi:2-polyprenyl-3-methyl-5-hydroxy-6-metoxy-1,4-benzoquinol methylase
MTTAIQLYTDYYGDARLIEWRQLGAKDKAANVIRLWSTVKPHISPRIADIGCGDGAVIRELDRRGFCSSYTGFEVSESGIACAQQYQYLSSTRFELFDGVCLPASDHSFDLDILSHVLEHAEEPRTLGIAHK